MAEEMENQGFDMKVTHRDDKTGQITHTTPYRLRMIKSKDGGASIKLLERPVGSGNLWNRATNEPNGRWVPERKVHHLTKKEYWDGYWDPEAEHINYVAPLSDDQKLQAELADKSSKLDSVQRELAAIKLERKKAEVVTPAAPKVQAKSAGAPKTDKGA